MVSSQPLYQILLSQRGEQNKATGAVCVCVWAECVCLCWSVRLDACICIYVLFTCARVHVPVVNTCSVLLLVGPGGTELQQHLSPGLLDLANPNSRNHTPRSVSSTDLLKGDSVTIHATDQNVEPHGHQHKSVLHSLSSSNWMLITTFWAC